MNLYLDLNKAVQVPNVSTGPKSGEQAARAHEDSFNTRSSGVSGGDPTPDDPDVGKKWRGSNESDEDDKPETTSKAVDILKAFTARLQTEVEKSVPNEREVEYLMDECGYSREEISKGYARIVGHERARFNTWLNARFMHSVSQMRTR